LYGESVWIATQRVPARADHRRSPTVTSRDVVYDDDHVNLVG
jgi:hypothetical protein